MLFNSQFFYDAGKISLRQNLVAYYALESNSNDRLGLHNGTDTAVTYSTGKVGNAGNYLPGRRSTIPNHSDFNFTTGGGNDTSFSFSVWCFPTSTGTNFIFAKLNDVLSNSEWSLLIFNQKIRFSIGNATYSAFLGIENVSVLPINTWYHIVATYDGSKLSSGLLLYINGVQASTTNLSSGVYTGMVPGTLNPTIGFRSSSSTASEAFDGLIDELGVWKGRIINQAEVNYLYNGGLGITYPV